MPVAIRVQTGAYQDSVKLMRISAAGSARSNVEIAVAIMATETNLDNLVNAGFDPAVAADASPNDLILAARADTAEAAEAVAAAVAALVAATTAPVSPRRRLAIPVITREPVAHARPAPRCT